MNKQARVVRTVTVVNRSWTVDEDVGDWFPCQVITSTDTQPAEEESPRAYPADRLRFMNGFRAPAGGVPQAAARVQVLGDDRTFELLPDPRPLYRGSVLEAWEARMLDVNTLYPLRGDLAAQDGGLIAAEVPLVIYGGSDAREAVGTYENLNAEADASVALLVEENSYFEVDSRRYRVLERVLDTKGPHIRMSVRTTA